MARPFTPKVVTANDLLEGDVIYLTANGSWSRVMAEAELLVDEARADAQLAIAESQPATIVGAYLTDAIAGTDGAPQPVHFKEDFRRTGPSNYFHGKQAEL